MRADPVRLTVCQTVRDHLTGTLRLVVGVMNVKGAVILESYEVHFPLDGGIELLKDDGEVYAVEPGGRCSCDDAKYRRRVSGCKHALAVRMAGLFEVRNGNASRVKGDRSGVTVAG